MKTRKPMATPRQDRRTSGWDRICSLLLAIGIAVILFALVGSDAWGFAGIEPCAEPAPPVYVVARNYWQGKDYDTRPVYGFAISLANQKKRIARAPVGEVCDSRFVRKAGRAFAGDKSKDNEYRLYILEDGRAGQVLCARKVTP